MLRRESENRNSEGINYCSIVYDIVVVAVVISVTPVPDTCTATVTSILIHSLNCCTSSTYHYHMCYIVRAKSEILRGSAAQLAILYMHCHVM